MLLSSQAFALNVCSPYISCHPLHSDPPQTPDPPQSPCCSSWKCWESLWWSDLHPEWCLYQASQGGNLSNSYIHILKRKLVSCDNVNLEQYSSNTTVQWWLQVEITWYFINTMMRHAAGLQGNRDTKGTFPDSCCLI